MFLEFFKRGRLKAAGGITAFLFLFNLGVALPLSAEVPSELAKVEITNVAQNEDTSPSNSTPLNDGTDINDSNDSTPSNDLKPSSSDDQTDNNISPINRNPNPTTSSVNQPPVSTKPVLLETKTLDKGISYYSMAKVLSDNSPVNIHYVKVDLNQPWVEIRPVLAGAGFYELGTLTNITQPYGAIAAINGPFYYPGGQRSVIDTTIIDQKLIVQSPRAATSLIITTNKDIYIDQFLPYTTIRLPDKKLIFRVDAMNRPCETANGIAVYNSMFGQNMTNNGEDGGICTELVLKKDSQGKLKVAEIINGSTTIPPGGVVISFKGTCTNYVQHFSVGDTVVFEVDLKDKPDILHMISNGPQLLSKGCKTVPINREGLDSGLWARHPRTAIGLTAKREVLMVVVDGRQETSVGVTFDELADIMLELGAVEAMALDGGGSSELLVKGDIANSLSDGRERKISAGLVVLNQIPIFINDKRIYFELTEVPPTMENNRILVPVRKIFEALGAEVSWEGETRTVIATKGKTKVELPIGSTRAKVNGKNVKLDVPAKIHEERTLVPLRFVSQALGGKVSWDANTGSAHIYLN
ncbi:MAG: hypothetical protein GX755_09595 [Syntrophomonadaceae bacterium]|nr:hypothetical protein [Syntrophomonadaceae bacterium]